MAFIHWSNTESVTTSDSSNQKIKDGLENLNKDQVSQVMGMLSSSKRKLCLDIIQKNSHHCISSENQKSLEKTITEAKELPSSSISSKVGSSSLAEKAHLFITDYFLALFGFLSAHKAVILFEKECPFATARAQDTLNELDIDPADTDPIDTALVDTDPEISIENGSSVENKTLDGAFIDSLEGVTFQNCTIKGSFFSQSTLLNCRFENCTIEDTMFMDAELEDVTFAHCTIRKSSFEEASLKNCSFIDVKMPSTHFLEATVEQSQIQNSDLTDVVFFKALPLFSVDDISKSTAQITKPITTMLVDPGDPGFSVPKVASKIGERVDSILLRVGLYSQTDSALFITKEMLKLQKEVKSRGEEFSMAKKMIDTVSNSKASYPLSHRILSKAAEVAKESSAIFLPGGEDIPPEFYEGPGAGLQDFRRSLLELGLISNAFHKGIPLMGVCRGFQMANVYFGAQLLNVEGHQQVVQELKLNKEEKKGLYAHVMKDTLLGVSFHHQAVEQGKGAREHLEVSSAYDNLVKASEPKAGGASPMILLQFHPEFYAKPDEDEFSFGLSHENELFWKLLGDSAKAYKDKQAVLKEVEKREAS